MYVGTRHSIYTRPRESLTGYYFPFDQRELVVLTIIIIDTDKTVFFNLP